MNVGIIGLGLMGGSFAKTLNKKTDCKVFGFDVSENAILKAEMLGVIDGRLNGKTAKTVDTLIIATTPDKLEKIFNDFLPYLKKGAIITDFCGIKRNVVNLMKKYAEKYKDLIFVGGHPMAGREFSGIEHATSTLFDNASMILSNVNADIFTMEKIKAFYLTLGFREVVICSPEEHDEIIAYTSQLCHIVSNAFIKNKSAEKHDGFSAGSYKDMTRVARLNPTMWADLMSENKDNLLTELTELIDNLTEYKTALKSDDKELLEKLLSDGNERKLKIDVKSKKV
ncbi:MAG: prephenate dehydrogenase [Clostridia bacterium]|nr:prephenate dehydrogenase [Clostridia bacterium]